MKVWVNGRLVDADGARVSVRDHGLTVGDGVFETMKVVDGMPFAISRHLARLRGSAERLALAAPPDAELRAAVEETLAANRDGDVGRVRLTLTGGDGPPGTDRGDAGPTVLVVVGPAPARAATAAVAVVPWRRNERSAIAGAKTTSYAENVVALAYARRAGADEALFLDTQGRVCEGTGTNVFLVLDGRLVTPALSTGCLAGVTRGLVLEWCGGEEAELPADALGEASELFITSSTRDVQPVRSVDGRAFPAPGPVTAAAAAEFAERVAKELDP